MKETLKEITGFGTKSQQESTSIPQTQVQPQQETRSQEFTTEIKPTREVTTLETKPPTQETPTVTFAPQPVTATAEPQQQYQQQQPSYAYQQEEQAKPSQAPSIVKEEIKFQQVPKIVGNALAENARAAQYLFGDTDYINRQRDEHKSLVGVGFILIRGGGAINFQGTQVVPKSITVTMACHGTSMDFSRATFVHPVTTIYVVSTCASVRIIIPRGVHLETTGLAACANFGGPDDMDNNFPLSNAPTLRIKNFGVCAGTTVELNYLVDPMNIVAPQE